MENFVVDYLQKLYRQQLKESEQVKVPGPVLTISREPGCQGTALAMQLAGRLNEYYLPIGKKVHWEVISKKILEAAAEELETHKENIQFVFDSEQRSLWEDFIQTFTAKNYYSEWKIKNTIKKVIREFATQGYAIILGRGGAQITCDIKNSLHIKLVAPFQWRVERFMSYNNLSKAAATAKVRELDANREKLIKMLYFGCDYKMCYDVTYNVERLSTRQLLMNIIHLMEQKKMI